MEHAWPLHYVMAMAPENLAKGVAWMSDREPWALRVILPSTGWYGHPPGSGRRREDARSVRVAVAVDLRQALGCPQWNFVGASYGVPFVRAAMRVDEEGVRSAVLASARDPTSSSSSPGTCPSSIVR